MKRINLLAAAGFAAAALIGVSAGASAQDYRDYDGDYRYGQTWDANHDGRIDWRDRRIVERRRDRERREYRSDRRYGARSDCWNEWHDGYRTRVCR
jgi:hypothetical protein